MSSKASNSKKTKDKAIKSNKVQGNKFKKSSPQDPDVLVNLPAGLKYKVPGKRQRVIIGSIKVVRSGKVRKAKLYYLRERKGKSARISEKIKKSIGIDVSEQIPEKGDIKEVEKISNESKTESKKVI